MPSLSLWSRRAVHLAKTSPINRPQLLCLIMPFDHCFAPLQGFTGRTVVYLLGHALVDSGVGSDAPDLAGYALHALLALHHRQVDVLHPRHQGVLARIWGRGKGLRTDGPSYKWRSDRRI